MITELARPSDQTGFLAWCASGIPRNKSNQRIMWLKINFSCQGTAKHPASFPVFLGYFWRDVTRQACRENSRYRTWFQASSGNSDSANWPGYEAAKHPTVPHATWNKPLRRDSHSFDHSSVWDFSRLDFRRLPGPVFDPPRRGWVRAHFPEQRLVIELRILVVTRMDTPKGRD